MYCSKCGAKVDDDQIYCNKCGVKLNLNDKVIEVIENKASEDTIKKDVEKKNDLELDKKGLAGFILSTLGLGVLGIIFSSIGFYNISKGKTKGKGFAVAGIVISSITIGFVLFYILLICVLGILPYLH